MSCNEFWVTGSVEVLALHDMDDRHIVNAMRYVRRVLDKDPPIPHDTFLGDGEWDYEPAAFNEETYDAMLREIRRRGLREDKRLPSGNMIRRHL